MAIGKTEIQISLAATSEAILVMGDALTARVAA